MTRKLIRNVHCLVFTVLAAGAADAQTPGGAVCRIVFDAGKELTATPHHAYLIETNSGAKQSSEAIYSGGAIYVKIGGRWKKSPLTVRQQQQKEEENIRDARNASCRYLRDESAGGQAAEVYSAHTETDGLISETVVWLAKGNRRVLREEEDVNVSGEKMHMSIRIDYTDVAVPAISR